MARKRTATADPMLFEVKNRTTKESFRHLRNLLAGRFVGATRDDALLDEVLKCLACKLSIETNGQTKIDLRDRSSAAKIYREMYIRVRGEFPEIYAPDSTILLDDTLLVETMAVLNFSLLDAAGDPVGDAYEVFAGSESRSRSGQFFTPRNAVDLLVRLVDPQPGESVIDPACGAGGFLASVARHYREKGLSNAKIAESVGNLYGIEKDAYLAKLATLHATLLSKGHVHVQCGDSLSLRTDDGQPIKSSMPTDGFDVILTNPPFGVSIVAAIPEVLRGFELGRRWEFDMKLGKWQPNGAYRDQVAPQILFVERCLSMVRSGGRLGMVVPESILSNKSYHHVVEFIRSQATINAVVGMPESLFKTSGKGGTHTKTCLLVMTKGREKAKKQQRIFMAEAQWCGHDSRAREIPFDDLPKIGDTFEKHRAGRTFEPSPLGFLIDESAITDNVLCPRYFDPRLEAELARIHDTHTVHRFGDLLADGSVKLSTGNEVGKLAYGTGDVPFVRTSDISNWEIKADPKHCLSREIYNGLKDKQDVRPYDILMVRDGTYLIGTCAIVSDYDREIVFQSHIYKIRVNENPHGIDPFLLLAVLSSNIVQRQIKAKQFTQDIIDSLGDRIKDLLIPVPKDPKKRQHVTELVRKVIHDRIEARELARQARADVLA